MRFRTWPIVALSLTGLLLLLALSVLATQRKTRAIYLQLEEITLRHRRSEVLLHALRTDVQRTAILARDFLLDASGSESRYVTAISELKVQCRRSLADLRTVVSEAELTRVNGLEARLNDYWAGLEPLFAWTPEERVVRGGPFLELSSRTRRAAVIDIVREIELIVEENVNVQKGRVAANQAELRRYLTWVLWSSTVLGLVVAVGATGRIRVLEGRAEEQRHLAIRAESEMRRLSQQTVRAHEDDRKALSRELHDHVGQMLTALRLELGRAERSRSEPDAFASAVGECKILSEKMVRTVRDIALELRPSMLDDFGLTPALDWHVRDFMRRSGISVDLAVVGAADALPDAHRTCVYRVVQEALTNCARHSEAARAVVKLTVRDRDLDLMIADNGVGWNGRPSETTGGLGLLGIDERVRELGGSTQVESARGAGMVLKVHMPHPPTAASQGKAIADLAG